MENEELLSKIFDIVETTRKPKKVKKKINITDDHRAELLQRLARGREKVKQNRLKRKAERDEKKEVNKDKKEYKNSPPKTKENFDDEDPKQKENVEMTITDKEEAEPIKEEFNEAKQPPPSKPIPIPIIKKSYLNFSLF